MERWQKIVNAVIEKTPGILLISQLRVIHLIESNFNSMIVILWGHRLFTQGKRLKEFGEEQIGALLIGWHKTYCY